MEFRGYLAQLIENVIVASQCICSNFFGIFKIDAANTSISADDRQSARIEGITRRRRPRVLPAPDHEC